MLSAVGVKYRCVNNLQNVHSKQSVDSVTDLTLSALNKEMPPKHFLAVIAWLMIMTLAGIEAHRQRMKLMTRPSDGAALCATNPPTLSVKMSPAMPEAPGVVRCGMACTNDGGCKHFNYVPNESNRCQLYHYRPTTFQVRPHCQHYYQPGQKNILTLTYLALLPELFSSI